MDDITELTIATLLRLPQAEREEICYRILSELHATEVQRIQRRAKAA